MKTPAFLFISLAMSASAFSQTSVPAAPMLTAGAEFKGLRFDWDTVSGATWYQLEYRAHQTGAYVQVGDDFPAKATSTHFSFPVHLYDWTYARYRLAACNDAGCSRSAAVSVSGLRRDAVGYFKSSQPESEAMFGATGDLSPDGYNFVAAAPNEGATETSGYLYGGAAYVFRRGSDGKWFQRARFDVHNKSNAMDGISVLTATSGSGNTVAVALQNYAHGTQQDPRGEVDVYHANSGSGTYTPTRVPRLAVSEFGESVALSESGSILAVGVTDEKATVAIYKLVNGVWQNVRNLPGLQADSTYFCHSPVMSRDGKTIAELCESTAFESSQRAFVRLHSGSNWSVRTTFDLEIAASGRLEWFHTGLAIDATGNTVAVQFRKSDQFPNGAAEVRVYNRGTAGWSQVARLTPGAWRTKVRGDYYGTKLSLSGDGHTLAVGDPYDNGTGLGPVAAPLVSGTAQPGAVYVYRLTNAWRLANIVKPNYIGPSPGLYGFGEEVSLSQSGKTLLVPLGPESSSAKGIDGDWANADLHRSGAVFMY
jgi:hypothetical protein